MPNKPFKLSVVTPEKTVYDGEALSLVAPGEEGYLGVWADHAPCISYLKSGEIKITKDSGEKMELHNPGAGFLEVFKNRVVILLDSID